MRNDVCTDPSEAPTVLLLLSVTIYICTCLLYFALLFAYSATQPQV